nr:uncharacterized protein LOC124813550 [Hydra vulgaris]
MNKFKHSIIQKKFRKKHSEYRIAETNRMKNKRANMSEKEKEEVRQKDRERKKQKRELNQPTSDIEQPFLSLQSFGKALKKINSALPADSNKRKYLLKEVCKRENILLSNISESGPDYAGLDNVYFKVLCEKILVEWLQDVKMLLLIRKQRRRTKFVTC